MTVFLSDGLVEVDLAWILRSNSNELLLLGIHKRHCIQYSTGRFGRFSSENCSCLCNCHSRDVSKHMARTLISAQSPSFLSFQLHHSSFSNPSLALPMSQLILQPFRCFTYVILWPFFRFSYVTYVTWRAAHDMSRAEAVEITFFESMT